ncbi:MULTISPECIES: hypothetical protein [Enterococcus]|uniref:hypothetical protein n=1 Tax=Enterococcus TaxID=1350 RepID=UPI0010F4AA34|nr:MULTISPECIES: hypothetical protein [Enterococcus]KAF1301132.1 hypothetical protein BAU16_10350 [Enterococcus sp. JM9B]
MDNRERKRNWGLMGLYALLLITACLFHQIKYYFLARILLVIAIILIIVFWRYLFKNKLIGISFSSTVFQQNLQKNERRFLYALVILVMPILKLRNISVSDVVLSILLILMPIFLSTLDEKAEKKK